MDSPTPRLDALESRLSILEKRDQEKNLESEILELKEQNLSLQQEILNLKKVESRKSDTSSGVEGGGLTMADSENVLLGRLDQLQKDVVAIRSDLSIIKSQFQLPVETLVTVVPSTGEEFVVAVEPSHTVAELKSLIEEKTSVKGRYQILVFDDDILVDDEKTLADLGIGDKSVVKQTQKASEWEVLVKTEKGKESKLHVDYRTAVTDLISKAHISMGIPLDEHKVLQFNGKDLDPLKLLVEYGIKHNSIVVLVLLEETWTPSQDEKEMKIIIEENYVRRKYVLNVYPSTSVHHLKCQLHLLTQSRPECHNLDFKNETLDNDQKLSKYGITQTSVLGLRFKGQSATSRRSVQVAVKACVNDRCFESTEQLDYWNTLEDLKGLIHDEWAIPPHDQTWSLRGIMVKELFPSGSSIKLYRDVDSDVPLQNVTTVSDMLLTSPVRSALEGKPGKQVFRINKNFSSPYERKEKRTAIAIARYPHENDEDADFHIITRVDFTMTC